MDPKESRYGARAAFYFEAKTRMVALLLRRLWGEPPPAGRAPRREILLIGAATGDEVPTLLPHGRVTVVDLDPAVLTLPGRFPEVAARLADAAALPFADGTFDAALCLDVFEHVPDDRRAAAELLRVLRPGGQAVVSVPGHPRLFSAHDRALGHLRRYRPGELRALFAGARRCRLVRWNSLLLPPILLLRLARRGNREAAPAFDWEHLPGAAVPLLRAAFRAEHLLQSAGLPLPCGLTLFALLVR